jgi:hypothetical protein
MKWRFSGSSDVIGILQMWFSGFYGSIVIVVVKGWHHAPQVVLIFGWFIATICFFMNEDILMKYWSVFVFYGDEFICLFFMNEDILMKYWSVLLWRAYLSFFYEWRYFNELLIRFTVTSLSVFFFMNEDILMKYWSVLLIFHSLFR